MTVIFSNGYVFHENKENGICGNITIIAWVWITFLENTFMLILSGGNTSNTVFNTAGNEYEKSVMLNNVLRSIAIVFNFVTQIVFGKV